MRRLGIVALAFLASAILGYTIAFAGVPQKSPWPDDTTTYPHPVTDVSHFGDWTLVCVTVGTKGDSVCTGHKTKGS